jgi:phage tail-like protein
MAQAGHNGPFGAFNFLVEIDGVTSAGFSDCSGLCTQSDVIEYREGGDFRTRKIPGLLHFCTIVLKRGITNNRDLWNWRKNVMNGVVDRRSGAIVLLDEARQPVARCRFSNGWPTKWEGPHLNAKTSEVAIETLEITHEGLDFE